MNKLIDNYTSYLKLANTKSEYENLIDIAKKEKLSHEKFLELVLAKEYERRQSNSTLNRIKRAKFSCKHYLCDLIMDSYTDEVNQQINEITSLNFIEQKENVILIGNPGVGKTHLATAIGLEACLQGKSVLYNSIPSLIIELREAMNSSQFNRFKKQFNKYDLIILDELGYITFDQVASEILFNLLSERNNHGSVIITTNLSFEKWKDVFVDPILTGALVDRMIYT